MSIYSTPEALAANPPETWEVRKVGSNWGLYIEKGAENPINYYRTKREALEAKTDPNGWTRRTVEAERLWYAGVTPIGQKSYKQCQAERIPHGKMIRLA